jgi:uncharacterized protein YkwD
VSRHTESRKLRDASSTLHDQPMTRDVDIRRGSVSRLRLPALMIVAALAIAGCGSSGNGGAKTTARAAGQIGNPASSANGSVGFPGVGTQPPPVTTGQSGDAAQGANCASTASVTSVPVVSSATLCLLNAERAARRLRPLRSNPKLAVAATKHSVDMVRRTYFAHDTLGGGAFDTRLTKVGYLKGARSWAIGENIAWGTGTQATPASIVNEWMHSPPHRANILDRRYTEIGLGIATGAPENGVGQPGLTYTTDFGTRR